MAASLGSAACTKLLLDAGADVRAAMGTGKATALHLAAEDGHAECARMLLEHGAHLDWPNLRGQTPLHLGKHCGVKLKASFYKWYTNTSHSTAQHILLHKYLLLSLHSQVLIFLWVCVWNA